MTARESAALLRALERVARGEPKARAARASQTKTEEIMNATMSKSIYVGSTFSAWGREWKVVERQTRAREGVMYVIEDAGGHREARTRDTLLSVVSAPAK